MLKIPFRQIVTSDNYEFKRHTLYPCLWACVVFIFTGLVIIFKQGPLNPEVSVPYFAFALYFLYYARQTYKQEKLNAEENKKLF